MFWEQLHKEWQPHGVYIFQRHVDLINCNLEERFGTKSKECQINFSLCDPSGSIWQFWVWTKSKPEMWGPWTLPGKFDGYKHSIFMAGQPDLGLDSDVQAAGWGGLLTRRAQWVLLPRHKSGPDDLDDLALQMWASAHPPPAPSRTCPCTHPRSHCLYCPTPTYNLNPFY